MCSYGCWSLYRHEAERERKNVLWDRLQETKVVPPIPCRWRPRLNLIGDRKGLACKFRASDALTCREFVREPCQQTGALKRLSVAMRSQWIRGLVRQEVSVSGRHRDRTDGRGLASFLERTRSSRPWKERQRAQDTAFACTDGIVRV